MKILNGIALTTFGAVLFAAGYLLARSPGTHLGPVVTVLVSPPGENGNTGQTEFAPKTVTNTVIKRPTRTVAVASVPPREKETPQATLQNTSAVVPPRPKVQADRHPAPATTETTIKSRQTQEAPTSPQVASLTSPTTAAPITETALNPAENTLENTVQNTVDNQDKVAAQNQDAIPGLSFGSSSSIITRPAKAPLPARTPPPTPKPVATKEPSQTETSGVIRQALTTVPRLPEPKPASVPKPVEAPKPAVATNQPAFNDTDGPLPKPKVTQFPPPDGANVVTPETVSATIDPSELVLPRRVPPRP